MTQHPPTLSETQDRSRSMPPTLRSMAMNGMLACTARNQWPLNFSQCSRHMPQGTLTAMDVAPTAASFAGSAWGRSRRTGCVLASMARALMMGAGHCSGEGRQKRRG